MPKSNMTENNNAIKYSDINKYYNIINAINKLNLWDYIYKFPNNESFMYNKFEWINNIYKEVENDNHSAMSFALCLQKIKNL